MNSAVKGGDVKELELRAATSRISRRGVRVNLLVGHVFVCTSCNHRRSELVRNTNRELQYSNLLLTKAFARRTDTLRLRREQIL